MTSGPQPGDVVILIDGDNLTHRVYHANRDVLAPDGSPIGALTGWVRSVRLFRKFAGVVKSRWMIPCFDSKPSWRMDLLPTYKSGRSDRDDALEQQWPAVMDVCAALGMDPRARDGLEADDLIASYTEALAFRGCKVVIVSDDKDLLQLVRDDPSVVQMRRINGEIALLGPKYVTERYGVGPDLLGDLLALTGDKIDGIPGLDGVGVKTAAKVLRERGSLETAIDDWMMTSPPLGERIRDRTDDLRLWRQLIELRVVDVDLDAIRPVRPSRRALDEVFGRYGFPRWESAVDPVRE